MPLCTLDEYFRVTGPDVGQRQLLTFPPLYGAVPVRDRVTVAGGFFAGTGLDAEAVTVGFAALDEDVATLGGAAVLGTAVLGTAASFK